MGLPSAFAADVLAVTRSVSLQIEGYYIVHFNPPVGSEQATIWPVDYKKTSKADCKPVFCAIGNEIYYGAHPR